MDKISDTPRTNFVAHKTGDSEWNRSMNRFGRMLAHAQILERELAAAQAEIERLKKRRDECCNGWGAALKDAVENMDIANEFKKLMEQYRQREAEANKALRVAAGMLSTMPQFSNMHPEDVMECILKETMEKK